MFLINETRTLIDKCDAAQERFFEAREQDLTYDFFEMVKPYADETRDELIAWREQMIQFINEYYPKNLYLQQIDHAIEAMEQFVVQSFYQQTSKKRFLQSIQSVKYTLTVAMKKMQEVQNSANEKADD